MADETNKKTTGRRKIAKPKDDRAMLDEVLEEIRPNLKAKAATVSEFLRLLQMRRELGGDEIRRIEVRWVEPSETENAGRT